MGKEIYILHTDLRKPRKGRNITAQGDANEASGALGQRAEYEIPALPWAGQICAAPADIGVAIMPRIPVSRPRPPAGN